MGGQNPYLSQIEVPLPKTKYRVTFLPMNKTVEVDPDHLPQGYDGRPGSVLSIALANGILLDHSCGGVCACSTCHVYVKSGLDTCNQSSDDEDDMIQEAPGLEDCSRLGCQTVPDGSKDVVVEIPEWNRNLVKEAH
ncbi:MAG: 2Fe-2S iron-sulfur cluster-binding protein [Acidobacteriia bacterium]|nr:2Fe-2S iron-sulfur cluster-binding protein [Terriglobia bacterium]